VASSPALSASADAQTLEREAAAVLAGALADARVRGPGRRDQHRRQIQRAIELAQAALAAAAEDRKTIAGAHSTLVKAHAARAQDARHGAGQLALGSQRAPTREACDDGWQRVAEIVAVAEASAAAAARLAQLVDKPSVRKAAQAAEVAARDARRMIDERNHAYTFHADPKFSFGEGWYLAAAAVLDEVAIQIEPDQPQTTQAERFLRDVGVSPCFRPYRSRPRANKHLPEIVARAFRADPISAQRQLREAFLGDAPVTLAIAEWIDSRLGAASAAAKKVLVWVRHGAHHPSRNSTHAELVELVRRACIAGLQPILIGDAIRGDVPAGAVDMTLFWKDPIFQGEDMRRAQLQFFEHLRSAHGLVGQVGVTTAGMDGPALMGLPTLYLTAESNVRLGTWVGAVPGYEEVVRSEGYLERISETFRRWGARSPAS
jgi:hypothetical protein